MGIGLALQFDVTEGEHPSRVGGIRRPLIPLEPWNGRSEPGHSHRRTGASLSPSAGVCLSY